MAPFVHEFCACHASKGEAGAARSHPPVASHGSQPASASVGGHRNLPASGHKELPRDGRLVTERDPGSERRAPDPFGAVCCAMEVAAGGHPKAHHPLLASASAAASFASIPSSICFGQVVCAVISCASSQPMMWCHSAAASRYRPSASSVKALM